MEKFNFVFTFRRIIYALLIFLILLFINLSFSQDEEVVVPETPSEESISETPTQEAVSTPIPSSSLVTTTEKSYIKALRPVSLKGEKVKIETIAQEIKNSFGIDLILKTGVAGQRLDLNITTDDLFIALDSICAPSGWVWNKENETTYSIMTRKEYEDTILPTQVEKKVFKLENISATDADRILRPLATPRIGKIYGDPRTNKLFVEDLPNVISEIEYILGQIDVKLVMRVFYQTCRCS